MRYSVATGMVLAAFSIGEAIAGPTHAHLHSRHHQKKDNIDYAKINWDNLGVDWAKAWAAGQPKATTTQAPVAKATTTAAATTTLPAAVFKEKAATTTAKAEETPKISSANSIIDDLEDLFDGIVGHANDRSSFGASRVMGGGSSGGAGLAGDFENGNIGEPYASNVMKVGSTSGYDFTTTFINTQRKVITINIWNKGGSDLQPLSGASLAPKDTALTFTLRPGASQIVAFADQSYIAWAEACSQRSFEGSFATTWGEAKYQSTGSGFDVSAIKNANGNDYDMTMTAEEVSCVSDMNQNMWLTPDHPVGGSNGSCYVPGSKMHLTVKMGGRK